MAKSENSTPSLLSKLPGGIKYPLLGLLGFSIAGAFLALVCGIIYVVYILAMWLGWKMIAAFVGAGIAYWVLYNIGKSIEETQ